MCGIYCSLSKQFHIEPSEELKSRLQARGPDSEGTVLATFDPETTGSNVLPSRIMSGETYLAAYSTVLSLRGSQIVTQPFRDGDDRFTFCWNGEAWSIDGERPSGSDTDAVFQLLTNALDDCRWNAPESVDASVASTRTIAEALSRIAGPYAFVLFDHARCRLYLGRDFLGRRSLMVKATGCDSLVVSSVSDGEADANWVEVETTGVHCVDLKFSGRHSMMNGALGNVQSRVWGDFEVMTAPYPLAGAASSNNVGVYMAEVWALLLTTR